MGCGASKSSVIPVGDIPEGMENSSGVKSASGTFVVASDPNIDDLNISARTTNGLAFEVPLNEDDNMIKKHPPKRFQKLEEQQMTSPLTHRLLDEKQAEAEQRRQQILNQRIQSAKSRQKLKKRITDNQESNENFIENMKKEPSTVEL